MGPDPNPVVKPILEVENLCVDINVPSGVLHAVQNVSFSLAKGETLCIVGESGCGKSTLARILLGLQPVKSGTVLLDGVQVIDMDPKVRARRIQQIGRASCRERV